MKQKMHKKIIVWFAVWLAISFSLSLALPVLASDVNNLWGGSDKKSYIITNSGLPSDASVSDPRLVAARVINFILGFLGIIAVIIILYAGFKWMLSGGSEDKVGEAKKMLIAGAIGLVIVLSAFLIANFVINQIYGATTGTVVF